MKRFWDHAAEISRLLSAKQHVFFFDFDGTLSPIADHPDQAVLPALTKKQLTSLASLPFVDVVIVSGRKLDDIEQRVAIAELAYAGNHGAKWSRSNRISSVTLSHHNRAALQSVGQRLKAEIHSYPGAFVEVKGHSIALHYRQVSTTRQKDLVRQVLRLAHTYPFEHMQYLHGRKVIDFRPVSMWNKGIFCREFLKTHNYTADETSVVYVGDDTTDEDAFAVLDTAVTVRVGRKSTSKATYFIASQKEISELLGWFLSYLKIKN